MWQWKISPLAVSRILTALRASSHQGLSHSNYPVLSTQRSLYSNHPALSFLLSFFSLAHPQHSSLLYDSEVAGRVTDHLYHLPIKQDSPRRPELFVAWCQALCLF